QTSTEAYYVAPPSVPIHVSINPQNDQAIMHDPFDQKTAAWKMADFHRRTHDCQALASLVRESSIISAPIVNWGWCSQSASQLAHVLHDQEYWNACFAWRIRHYYIVWKDVKTKTVQLPMTSWYGRVLWVSGEPLSIVQRIGTWLSTMGATARHWMWSLDLDMRASSDAIRQFLDVGQHVITAH